MAKHDNLAEGIAKILVERKVVSPEEGESFKKLFYDRAKPSFVNFLLEEGLVTKTAILKALSEFYQKPYFDANGFFFDQHLVQMFPDDVMIRNLFIPIEQDQNMLVVLVSDPSNPELLKKIGEHVSYDIRFNVGIAQDIINAIREFSDWAVTQYPDELKVNAAKKDEEQGDVRGLFTTDQED